MLARGVRERGPRRRSEVGDPGKARRLPLFAGVLGWLGLVVGTGWLAYHAWLLVRTDQLVSSGFQAARLCALAVLSLAGVVASLGLLLRRDWARRLYGLNWLATWLAVTGFATARWVAVARMRHIPPPMHRGLLAAAARTTLPEAVVIALLAGLIVWYLRRPWVRAAMLARRSRGERASCEGEGAEPAAT